MTQLSSHAGHFHAVRFYKDDASLIELVADFLSDGFAATLPAIVIATPEHRAALLTHLRSAGLDTDRLTSDGDLILLDAELVLREFMVDGMPNASLFRHTISPVIEQACKGRKDCVVRAYGEMVDVLWKAGNTAAAIRLEMLWNDLARTHDFSLLCGYSMGNFYKDATQKDITAVHSHVVPEGSRASLSVN